MGQSKSLIAAASSPRGDWDALKEQIVPVEKHRPSAGNGADRRGLSALRAARRLGIPVTSDFRTNDIPVRGAMFDLADAAMTAAGRAKFQLLADHERFLMTMAEPGHPDAVPHRLRRRL